MLGVPDLDSETQHALFPNFPTTDDNSGGGRWKWSDVGAAPALHQFVQHTKHVAADKAIACNKHKQEAHERGAVPNTARETVKQACAERCIPGNSNALKQGRSGPTCQRSSPTGVYIRSPSCSPDPEHYLVSLRWGALSTPPLHPQLPTPQHSSACLSGSTSQSPPPPRFSTSPSRYHAGPIAAHEGSNPNRGLSPEQRRLIAPQCSSPSEGLVAASPVGDEGRFKSASPSVARACVTLPGFCPPAKAPHLAEGMSTEAQHEPVQTTPAGKHFLQSMLEAYPTPLFCCFASLLLFSMCLS